MQAVDPHSWTLQDRTMVLFREHQEKIFHDTDRLFAGLMLFQWGAAIIAAFLISPKTWQGTTSQTHIHVYAAIFLGGLITLLPATLALLNPGRTFTRHSIAVGQMLMSALLIQITGGRIETHFHVFGSLAFLAFYRDWRVLLTASFVVALDHLLRGIFWPQSVYGILVVSQWRWLEHTGWVLFEDIFLIKACIRGVSEMHEIAERQASVEEANENIERKVSERTAELRVSEEAVRRIDRQKELILTSINEGILELDLNSRVVYVNPAAARMLGREVKNLIGSTFHLPVPEGKADEASSDSTIPLTATYTRHDGRTFPVEYSSTTFANKHSARAGSVVVFRDITERLRAEQEKENQRLLQLQKVEALGRLAGGIAHDFNNNLMAISGFCELLLMQMNQEDHLRSNVLGIQKAADQGGSLTRQLLAFGRKQILEPKLLNLNHVVKRIESMLQRVIREDIDLRICLSDNLGSIAADPGQLEQVIVNLVVNARDAIPRRGRITIETSNITVAAGEDGDLPETYPGNYVLLSVTDTGVGMDESTKSRIFEPFFTTKEKGKGTGLGLSTVYGIVKQSGGSIYVQGDLGKGTTFKLCFPRVDQPALELTDEPAAKKSSSVVASQTILLVDDNQDVRDVLAALLSVRGYEVIVANDGAEALEKFDACPRIHLLITDMVMPNMSGVELAQAVSAKRSEIKVLFMSGYSEEAIQYQGIIIPGAAFVSKPISSQLLLQQIDDLFSDPTAFRIVHSKYA